MLIKCSLPKGTKGTGGTFEGLFSTVFISDVFSKLTFPCCTVGTRGALKGHFSRVCPNNVHYACREFGLKFINPNGYIDC